MANYILDDLEKKRADAFKEHHKYCRKRNGISLPYKYIFTSNGIGNVVVIKCPYCGKEKDITNIDCW